MNQSKLLRPEPIDSSDEEKHRHSPFVNSQSQCHHESLMKGFNLITLAAAFIAAIQAQIMASTVGPNATEEPSIAIRAINSFYFGGLMLDIASAVLAFLTARWLDMLLPKDRNYLESEFHEQQKRRSQVDERGNPWRMADKLFYTWLGFSLFSPMPLLVFGVVCMVAGLFIFVWTQQHIIVASFFTLSFTVVLPMVIGIFYIGPTETRRIRLIKRLSEMQGDW